MSMSEYACQVCGQPGRPHEGKITYKGFTIIMCDAHFEQFALLQANRLQKQLEADILRLKKEWGASIHSCNTYADCALCDAEYIGFDEDGTVILYCREFIRNIKNGVKCKYKGYTRSYLKQKEEERLK